MEEAVASTCNDHTDRKECPDCLLEYNGKFDEYGIIIHDGGTSVNTIQFCPWCGSRLPDSKRDRWFEELEAIGITDPQEQTISEEYLTDTWHRKK